MVFYSSHTRCPSEVVFYNKTSSVKQHRVRRRDYQYFWECSHPCDICVLIFLLGLREIHTKRKGFLLKRNLGSCFSVSPIFIDPTLHRY